MLSSRQIFAKLALASLAVLPVTARAQDGTGQQEQKAATSTNTIDDPFRDGALKLPFRAAEIDLPQRVLDKAAQMGINPETIKLEQGKWLECSDKGCRLVLEATKEEILQYSKPEVIQGLRAGDVLTITGHPYSSHRVEAEPKYRIPKLGTFSTETDGTRTFTPDPEFTGTVVRAEDGAGKNVAKQVKEQPKAQRAAGAEVVEVPYSKDALKTVHDRLMLELDTTFVLVISVPSQCPPCRAYKPAIKDAASRYAADEKVMFVTINFDTFDEARRVMGPVRVFPTTILIPPLKPNTKFSYEDDPNWATKPFLSTIQRPGYREEGMKQSGPLQTIVSQARKVIADGLRGIKGSLEELLGARQ